MAAGQQVEALVNKRVRVQEQFRNAHDQYLGKDWEKKTYADYEHHKMNKYEKTVKKRIWTEADQLFENDLWNS